MKAEHQNQPVINAAVNFSLFPFIFGELPKAYVPFGVIFHHHHEGQTMDSLVLARYSKMRRCCLSSSQGLCDVKCVGRFIHIVV